MSVKLLEFKPKETTKKPVETLGSLIDEDFWFSRTPDLPALRYGGEIKVFIWDEFRTYRSMAKTLEIPEDSYKVLNYSVATVDEYLPFINGAGTKASVHDMLLPSSGSWNSLFPSIPSYYQKPAKLRGGY